MARRSPAAWPAALVVVHVALWLPGALAAVPLPRSDPRGRRSAEEAAGISAQRTLVTQPREADTVVIGTPVVIRFASPSSVRAAGSAPPAALRAAAGPPLPNLQVLCSNAHGPSALVVNRGTAPSLPTVLAIQKRVAMPGSGRPVLITLGERPVPPLDAYCEGAGCKWSFELQLGAADDPWLAGATIVLTVDPHDAVKESDETDNRCVLTVPAARSRHGR